MNLQPNTLIKHSNALHLGKYSYKVVLIGSNSGFLRGWREQLKAPEPVRPTNHVSANKLIYHDLFTLLRGKDISIRCEWRGAFVYTNDEALVEELVSFWTARCKPPAVYMPLTETAIPEGTVILKRKIPYNYRVTITFPEGKREYTSLVDWCNSVSSQIKMSSWSKQSLKNIRYWRSPIRIYVKDEKTISMLRLVAGNQVSKIEKIMFL